MITTEILCRIRRMFLRDGLGYSEISRRTGIARNTVKRWLKGAATSRVVTSTESFANSAFVPVAKSDTLQVQTPKYRKCATPKKLAPFIAPVEQALVADAGRIKRDRRTGKHLFIEIKANGYTGGYSGLTDFIREWRTRNSTHVTCTHCAACITIPHKYQRKQCSPPCMSCYGYAHIICFRLALRRFCSAFHLESKAGAP